jgi:mannosyltransferase OCH1-like enzyme
VVVEVSVRQQKYSGENRIPRIILQTWFEELTPERYPHLQRLHNSWKTSGWGYQFYTDATARVCFQEHYPDRFVEAYDAILPGAFKADLFRLCVLLKEGGIYADIDVQLDVNLDSFLTNNLSFLVPRDVAIDHWPRANYCLWNGLLGAAPGHPIIARAVEDLLNRILNRQDYMEGNVSAESSGRDLETAELSYTAGDGTLCTRNIGQWGVGS